MSSSSGVQPSGVQPSEVKPAVRGIVTPEAVVLEFETASVGSRAMAQAIDVLVRVGLVFVLSMVLGIIAAGLTETMLVITFIVTGFVLIFGYPVVCEQIWNGQTVGKRALGLRAVTTEGAPVRFRHSAIRSMLGLVDFLLLPPGVPATLSVLLTARNQRLGDLAAGTMVLREGSGATFPVAVSFPPMRGYEGYARSLDVGALTPAQYALVRSFLLRVGDLAPSARAHLGDRLATSTAAVLHHELPPGIHPEAFLVAVAAAYQLRLGGPPVPLPPWVSPWGAEVPGVAVGR